MLLQIRIIFIFAIFLLTEKYSHSQETSPIADAQFQGNDTLSFYGWIEQHAIYPTGALNKNIIGELVVQFTVAPSGKVSDVTLLKGRHPLLDAEALRVVQSSPDWIPAKKDGMSIEQRFVLKINFSCIPQASITVSPDQPIELVDPAYIFVDVQAGFQDGDVNTFSSWVEQSITYPTGFEKGMASVQFEVNSIGKVEKVKIRRNTYPLLNDEIIRVMKSSPQWTPAMLGGKSVRQFFVIFLHMQSNQQTTEKDIQ